MSINLNYNYASGFYTTEEFENVEKKLTLAKENFGANKSNAAGNEYQGWVTLPEDYDKEEFSRIKKAAEKIISDSEVLVVIGIGGSYLGARAAIEFVKSKNYNLTHGKFPQIFFVGNSISPTELNEVIGFCKDKDFSVNVISKSGTTTEPAIAFRIFKQLLIDRYGDKASERIYATTDAKKGTLHDMAKKEGYEMFVVPNDVGGRYSVLTAVGLLPIAVAGIDIDALMAGAAASMKKYADGDSSTNDCYKYAVIRNVYYNKGKKIEMMVSYEPDFTMMNEWLKQLFGESEGKDNKGLFPASVVYSTDLHSMGQYVQQGERLMFETVIKVNEPKSDYVIEAVDGNPDSLNFLAGKKLSEVNNAAFCATALAHNDGDVPCIVIEIDKMDAYNLGELIYFFEMACGISGYILGINPFDQPGVEAYKKNMFALLGKPGYEELREKITGRLS